MVDNKSLRKKIKDSGLKMTYIAEKIGLTYQGFLNKLDNKYEFTTVEVQNLCELLQIKNLREKEKIFFAKM